MTHTSAVALSRGIRLVSMPKNAKPAFNVPPRALLRAKCDLHASLLRAGARRFSLLFPLFPL
jgi:hypothetical protein